VPNRTKCIENDEVFEIKMKILAGQIADGTKLG